MPHLGHLLSEAALVISHCGAGSTFEALRARVPLIAVPNPLLMDDHQAELAQLLASERFLVRFLHLECACSSSLLFFFFLRMMHGLHRWSALGRVCTVNGCR